MLRKGEAFLLLIGFPLVFGFWSQANNNSGNCLGEDYIDCYENILEYIDLGEKAIKISEEKKALIVIGLTRVGKSTFTQFVANHTNPLTIKCEGLTCQLLDDSGDGSDSVISKTFVPNTVEDKITNGILTPFYDMPGFDDTRNISIEIANSFFIQKVIRNIEEIKIIVVAKQASFSSTETSFKALITFLAKFCKDPEKFRNSIVLISNFGVYGVDDSAHFFDIQKYLVAYNESMYGDESSHPDPAERESVMRWIERFLEAPEDAPEKLQKVAIFRSPDIRAGLDGKSIRDVEDYQRDLARMKQLIWDESEFSPLTPDDIGFTLSADAELFIERASGEASTTIRKKLTSFAFNIQTYLQALAKGIIYNQSEEDMEKLYKHFITLQNLSFQSCNNAPTSSPRSCIDQIISQLSILAGDMHDSIFSDINRTTNFLQFTFAKVGKEKQYDMRDWVVGFHGLDEAVLEFLWEVEANVTTAIISNLTQFSDVAHSHFLQTFILLTTLPTPTDLHLFNQTISELTQLQFTHCNHELPNSPLACFQEIFGKISSIFEATGSSLKDDIRYMVNLREFLSSQLNISSSLGKLVEPLTSLKIRVENTLEEKDIPEKIFNLMRDELSELAKKLSSSILSHNENNTDLEDLIDYLNGKENQLKSILTTFENYNTRGSLAGYVELVMAEYEKVSDVPIEKDPLLDVIYMTELLKPFPWFSPIWINFHRDNLLNPVSTYLVHNKRRRIIYYTLSARNVPNNESPIQPHPDPYAKVFSETKSYVGSTEVDWDTSNPAWSDNFYVVYNPGGIEQLQFYEIWDKDVMFDDLLTWGNASVREMYRNGIGILSAPLNRGATLRIHITGIDSTKMGLGK